MTDRPETAPQAGADDLDACAREPIHVPGAIQPHGALLVLDPDKLCVRQASTNAATMIDSSIAPGIGLDVISSALHADLFDPEALGDGTYQRSVDLDGRSFHVTGHRSGDDLIVEFEALSAADEDRIARVFPRLKSFAERVGAEQSVAQSCHIAARFLRELNGFDRVLIYRFDSEWNGHVIAEDGDGTLPSYLDLRFPAGDIPAQARELYRLNRLRIIPDVDYEAVRVEPALSTPLDMSFATLRSVSPIHLEYMRNMGTASSMSVSIIIEGELWGLVACHSRDAHRVSINIRNACDFAVQSLATVITSRQKAEDAAERVGLAAIQSRLLSAMSAADDWREGLAGAGADLLRQVDAAGAAIVLDDDINSVGSVPDEAFIHEAVDWLEASGESELYCTDKLPTVMRRGEGIAERASGLLAIRLSELHPEWLLWFRPEVVRTVEWGGDPHKYVREKGRIHPRVSFESWKEQVRDHCVPWRSTEIEAARDLRSAVTGIVLRRAEEKAQLTEELQQSNKELEAFSYSVSHDLRAPFRHIVGYSELLRERAQGLDEKSLHYLESISESAVAAGRLVDDLLNFSQVGRAEISRKNVDMNKIVIDVRRSLDLAMKGRHIDWDLADLPIGWCDVTLIRQVWYNLMENAVKYSRERDPACICVSGWKEGGSAFYRIQDNGVGFDMAYQEKMFGVFQRLQREEDFEGTGIGLALAKRIVDRHGGTISAEGELDRGASFIFSLPNDVSEAR